MSRAMTHEYIITGEKRDGLLALADAYADAMSAAARRNPHYTVGDVLNTGADDEECCSCDCSFCGDDWTEDECREARLARDALVNALMGLRSLTKLQGPATVGQ